MASTNVIYEESISRVVVASVPVDARVGNQLATNQRHQLLIGHVTSRLHRPSARRIQSYLEHEKCR